MTLPTGITQVQIEEAIAESNPKPTTLIKLQELIDQIDLVDIDALISRANIPADGDPSIEELTGIGISIPTGLTQEQIEEKIAASNPKPTTIGELQELIDELPEEIAAVSLLISRAHIPADGDPTIAEITEIGVVIPEDLTQEVIEEAIAQADPKPTTVVDLQQIVDWLKEQQEEFNKAITDATNPATDGTPSIQTLVGLGIILPDGLTQVQIEEKIATAEPKPTNITELQALIDQLALEVDAIKELVAQAKNPNQIGPAIQDLTVLGVVLSNGISQQAIKQAIAIANPEPTTVVELQRLMDSLKIDPNQKVAPVNDLMDPNQNDGMLILEKHYQLSEQYGRNLQPLGYHSLYPKRI